MILPAPAAPMERRSDVFTLTSLYDYDNELFSGIDVGKVNQLIPPEDNTVPMNQETLINTIMFRCGLLQPIYSEPATNKQLFKIWWEGESFNFAQMWRSMHAGYNPIENYNRFTDNKLKMERDHTDTNRVDTRGSDTETLSGNDKNTEGGTDRLQDSGTDTTRNYGSDVTEHQVSAFNEASYQNKDKDTTNHGKATDIDYGKQSTTTYGHTNQIDYGRKATTQYGRGEDTHFTQEHHDYDELHEHVHGNIGVTTTQQMIESELALRAKSVYTLIAEDFERKFCIGVY